MTLSILIWLPLAVAVVAAVLPTRRATAAFSLVGEPPRGVRPESIRFPSEWRFTGETLPADLAVLAAARS